MVTPDTTLGPSSLCPEPSQPPSGQSKSGCETKATVLSWPDADAWASSSACTFKSEKGLSWKCEGWLSLSTTRAGCFTCRLEIVLCLFGIYAAKRPNRHLGRRINPSQIGACTTVPAAMGTALLSSPAVCPKGYRHPGLVSQKAQGIGIRAPLNSEFNLQMCKLWSELGGQSQSA